MSARYRVDLDKGALAEFLSGGDVVECLDDAGEQVADRASVLAPKRTGQGAENIAHETGSDSDGAYVRIGYLAPGFHLAFQELGTARHPAQPHLRPAIGEDVDI